MTVNNNNNEHAATTKLHIWEAFYHPYSGGYEESCDQETDLEKLSEDVLKVVTLGHDITIQIVPDFFVVVYATDAGKLKRYKEMMGTNYIRWLLDKKYQEQEEYVEPCYLETYDFPTSI